MATPSPDSKSEMMFLGQECNHPACYLHDFLPFNVRIFRMNDEATNADKPIVSGMSSCFLPTSLSSISTFMYSTSSSIHGGQNSTDMPYV